MALMIFALHLLLMFATGRALPSASLGHVHLPSARSPQIGSARSIAQGSSDAAQVISVAKDVANVLFFIVVGTVTILTYIKAKRTILQPMRTEVFKQQITLFTQLLHELIGKSEVELIGDAGLDAMVRANVACVLDQYAAETFYVQVDEQERPYNRKECPQTIFTLDPDVTSITTGADGLVLLERVERPWTSFRLAEMKVPTQYVNAKAQFISYLESPLLPSHLASLVQEYLDALDTNVDHIRTAVEELAQTLPARFPTLESMSGVTIGRAENRFNELRVSLKPIAERIVKFVREYFATDKLLDA